MPIIKRIKGIAIRMFYGDHPPPHIHGANNENNGYFDIDNQEMLEGDLSSKDQKIIKKWCKNNKNILKDMWNSQDIKKID